MTVNYTNINGCTALAPVSSTPTNVTLSPPAPTGAAVQNFCSEVSPTVASLIATGTVNPDGTRRLPGAALWLRRLPLVNNTHYFASQTVTGCESLTRLDVTALIFSIPPAPVAAPGTGATCSQITANWAASAGATSYRLDVSTVNTFASYVAGYQDRNVGNVLTFNVTGLTAGIHLLLQGQGSRLLRDIRKLRNNYICHPSGCTGNSGRYFRYNLHSVRSVTGQIYSIGAVLNATTYTWSVPAGWSQLRPVREPHQ